MQQPITSRSSAWRSRWAALGAAVAVTLGAGGLIAVDAASSDPSSLVTVEPTRILDTRTNVGLDDPPGSGSSEKLQVTGVVETQPPGSVPAVMAEVVPATATAVILNATVVRPSTKGFLSVRPGDAIGDPATSNINWDEGGANIANSITVQIPPTGQIDIFVNGTVGHVLIDVAGFMIPAISGPAGPEGPAGDPGADGAKGDQGGVGPVGPFAELDPVGQFTPRQNVNGAILECGGFVNDLANVLCTSPTLNGVDLDAVDLIASADAICQVVNGSNSETVGLGSTVNDPKFRWDGARWVIVTASTPTAASVNCGPPNPG